MRPKTLFAARSRVMVPTHEETSVCRLNMSTRYSKNDVTGIQEVAGNNRNVFITDLIPFWLSSSFFHRLP